MQDLQNSHGHQKEAYLQELEPADIFYVCLVSTTFPVSRHELDEKSSPRYSVGQK